MTIPNGGTATTNIKFVIGGAIIIVGIAAYVLLAVLIPTDTGAIRGAIIILITPVTTVLFVAGAAEPIIASLQKKQDTIVHQTNGLSTEEKKEIAEQAASLAIAKHVARVPGQLSPATPNSTPRKRKPRVVKSDN